MSVGHYEENAQTFFDRTVGADISDQLERFAALLPPGGRVLDAGCGSGRDTKAFRERGFRVTATEAAPALAALARAHAGVEVQVLTFDRMAWTEAFDGIWACASLLHVPKAELADTVARLRSALVPCGVFYMSFKYGTGERQAGDRHFTDLDEAGAQALLAEVGGLELLDLRTTGDARAAQAHERWLVLICRRSVQLSRVP